MSQAGWYPDPGGSPGQYRYWDGRAWAPTTSSFPGTPGEQSPAARRGPWPWVVLVAGVLVVAVITWFVWPQSRPIGIGAPDTNSARPTQTGWNEQQPTTLPPVEGPTGGTMVDCPTSATPQTNQYPNDGWLYGGGLKVKQIPAWVRAPVHMGWVYDMSAQTDEVAQSGIRRWFSMISVGALHTVDGFESPKVSAFQVMSCFATSQYYGGYTGRQDMLSEQFTVNGRPGWRLRSEVYVSMDELPDIKGDWIDVIVIDVGNPESLGVFISSVTIDDAKRLTLVENAIKSLATN